MLSYSTKFVILIVVALDWLTLHEIVINIEQGKKQVKFELPKSSYYDYLQTIFVFYIGGVVYGPATRKLIINSQYWRHFFKLMFVNYVFYYILALSGYEQELSSGDNLILSKIIENKPLSPLWICYVIYFITESIFKIISHKGFILLFFTFGFVKDMIDDFPEIKRKLIAAWKGYDEYVSNGCVHVRKNNANSKSNSNNNVFADNLKISMEYMLSKRNVITTQIRLLEEESCCTICLEVFIAPSNGKRSILFKPCGHRCICTGCFIKWANNNNGSNNSSVYNEGDGKLKCLVCFTPLENRLETITVENQEYMVIVN